MTEYPGADLPGRPNFPIIPELIITGWERTVHTTLCLDLYSEQILVSICRIGFKIDYFCVFKITTLENFNFKPVVWGA